VNRVADRIRDRTASIVILGMGRVGLPLGIALARAGLRVIGVDPDDRVRGAICQGVVPFHDPSLVAPLAEAIATGRMTIVADGADSTPDADAIVVCVGTPLTADLRADDRDLLVAISQVAPSLRRGQLLVVRSTVPPGTLTKVVRPFLEANAQGPLLLAVCPERIAEGRALEELATLPEIVGAADPDSAEAASALFGVLGTGKQMHVTDPTSAEITKLINNVYRYVNFALSNEFAILGENYGVDIHRILRIANEDYPRANIAMPGPAGGPCLSKDGYFLVGDLPLPDFVLMAWKLNDGIPAHVVRRLVGRLNQHGVRLAGAPVAVLGRTFKRDSGDLRQSPAERIVEILRREGAVVRAHDPSVPAPTLEDALHGARAFVLAMNHGAYEGMEAGGVAGLMVEPRVGIDCWGMLDGGKYQAAGVDLMTFGVGDGQ
jgi:nucleotide sugar dehydrogenase